MPRGGARKGAGRKPKPLAEKLAAGNPGHRPLKKLVFPKEDEIDWHELTDCLPDLEKREHEKRMGIPTLTRFYALTIRYLEQTGCLNQIPVPLIVGFASACYNFYHAQYELGKASTVMPINGKFEITEFAEAVLKMQKKMVEMWEPINNIISRSCERLMTDEEQEFWSLIFGGRRRKKKPKGEMPDGLYPNPENLC